MERHRRAVRESSVEMYGVEGGIVVVVWDFRFWRMERGKRKEDQVRVCEGRGSDGACGVGVRVV